MLESDYAAHERKPILVENASKQAYKRVSEREQSTKQSRQGDRTTSLNQM